MGLKNNRLNNSSSANSNRSGDNNASAIKLQLKDQELQESRNQYNELLERFNEIQLSLQSLESERDFYYDKLRAIEVYCEPFDKEAIADADESTRLIYEKQRNEYEHPDSVSLFADKVRNKLFEEREGFTQPDSGETNFEGENGYDENLADGNQGQQQNGGAEFDHDNTDLGVYDTNEINNQAEEEYETY